MQNKIIITFLVISVFCIISNEGLPKESRINNENKINTNINQNLLKFGTCFVCKETIIQMRFFLSNPQMEEKIRKYIRLNLCPKIGIFQQMCEDFVDNEMADFFEDMEFYMNNPEQACMEMSFCPINNNISINSPSINFLSKEIEKEENKINA